MGDGNAWRSRLRWRSLRKSERDKGSSELCLSFFVEFGRSCGTGGDRDADLREEFFILFSFNVSKNTRRFAPRDWKTRVNYLWPAQAMPSGLRPASMWAVT
jgi:hypothetical protein